jgi:predicted Rossmann fold flavoprotein
MKNDHEIFDIAVIGGGPAGMLAAGRAAELGAKVVLIEKNESLGTKLLITGKGRCNITQANFDEKDFIIRLGKKGKFLFSSLTAFGPKDVIDFFEERGLKTKIERGGRVFPVSNKSLDVLNVLLDCLRKNKVKILLDKKVIGFGLKDEKIGYAKLIKEKIYARNFIISTGGKAYPVTGSTGDGYSWAKVFGHKLINPTPALVPIKTSESWIKNLQGLSLKNVRINVIQNGKKVDSRFGEMLFTHFGISGPIVLDVSKSIRELLNNGEVTIELDLKPALDFTELDQRLQRDFAKFPTKAFKNYLPELLPRKSIYTMINFSGIDSQEKLNAISRDKRKKFVKLLKGVRMSVVSLMGFDEAIITSGGVDLKEIDPKTMHSKIVKNLFLAGEIIDLDGPTGGYNLQICWSTGFAAGTYAAGKIKK